MSELDAIAGQIELHSVEGIRECFLHGVNPNDIFNGHPLLYELTSEYTRSPRFKDCVKAFVDYGLQLPDTVLLSVFLDNAECLHQQLSRDKQAVTKKYSLRCAYTPLHEVTLLHICAEFNHRLSAEVLLYHGADINARAGMDENGFGGQTPIFHTVNQNGNHSAGMLEYLLAESADLSITVPGLIWGKGYAWETLIPSVNPISYAMMGMLPQMHRDEKTIANIVSRLLQQQYEIDYTPENIPCKYLKC
ncbi:MAG: ankyrin repeat domain-containing protein [Bacteroidota bacterium]